MAPPLFVIKIVKYCGVGGGEGHCGRQNPTKDMAPPIFPVLKLDLVIQATDTTLNSCSGKKYAYALHASCFYIEIIIFEHF